MRAHAPGSQRFIQDLRRLGSLYGLRGSIEYRPSRTSQVSVDVCWRTPRGAPVVFIEVESSANPNMVQNAMKIYGSIRAYVRKPWFFFHVVLNGTAGTYRQSLSILTTYAEYRLYENLFGSESIQEHFLSNLHDTGMLMMDVTSSQSLPERFHRLVHLLHTRFIRGRLRERIVEVLQLPRRVRMRVAKGELGLEQARALEKLPGIMKKSPKQAVEKIANDLADICIDENLNTAELEQRLRYLKYLYLSDRFTLHNMNAEHDNNIKLKGTCFCFDLRRNELRSMGYPEPKIEEILRVTMPWSRQDHIHALCHKDLSSEEFKIVQRVMRSYGIHHSDMGRLALDLDEAVWLLKDSNQWETNDRGLCWSCGEVKYEVELNGRWYCLKCAEDILKDRARLFKETHRDIAAIKQNTPSSERAFAAEFSKPDLAHGRPLKLTDSAEISCATLPSIREASKADP